MSHWHLAAWVVTALSLLVIPVVFLLVDRLPAIFSRFSGYFPRSGSPVHDFQILVPIYGSVSYLENVRFLAEYGDKVLLCTTSGESAAFNDDLDALALRYGFRVFRAPGVGGGAGAGGRRATSGTVRDRLVQQALEHAVTTPYVVCIDADTTTERPFSELVGALVANGYDFASVPLVPSNTGSGWGRLQAYEYRTAMRLRRIAPWQVSGACHAGRTAAHRDIMRRHSLFFQGNDVEAGLLARALGYRVGHLPLPATTTVPERFHPWYRQRLAWSGGEFRLFIVNVHLLVRHPFFWIYGTVVATLGLPLRWMMVTTGSWALLTTLAVYYAVTVGLHWRDRTRWLFVLPFYSLFSSLVMTPLGAFWYVRMAVADRNAGFITPRRLSL
jgi:hypothetical protein